MLKTAFFLSFVIWTLKMSHVSVVTSPVVNVTVTSTVTSFASEKHFQKDLTVAALKACFGRSISVVSKRRTGPKVQSEMLNS